MHGCVVDDRIECRVRLNRPCSENQSIKRTYGGSTSTRIRYIGGFFAAVHLSVFVFVCTRARRFGGATGRGEEKTALTTARAKGEKRLGNNYRTAIFVRARTRFFFLLFSLNVWANLRATR